MNGYELVEPVSLLDVGDDVLGIIFSLLNVEDRSKLAGTCRRCLAVWLQPHVWKRIDFCSPHAHQLPNRKLLSFLPRARGYLEELHCLRAASGLKDYLYSHRGDLSNLQHCSLCFQQTDFSFPYRASYTQGLEAFDLALFNSAPHLKTLQMSSKYYGTSEPLRLPELTHLRLASDGSTSSATMECPNLIEAVFIGVLPKHAGHSSDSILQHTPRLQSLVVGEVRERVVWDALSKREDVSGMHTVILRNCRGQGPLPLASRVVARMPNLHTLVSAHKITSVPASVRTFGASASHAPVSRRAFANLQSLALKECREIPQALCEAPVLTRLALAFSRTAPAPDFRLLEPLAANLTHLALSLAESSDTDVTSLVQGAAHSLEALLLRGVRIDFSGMVLPKLRTLDLTQCRVKAKGKCMPALEEAFVALSGEEPQTLRALLLSSPTVRKMALTFTKPSRAVQKALEDAVTQQPLLSRVAHSYTVLQNPAVAEKLHARGVTHDQSASALTLHW